MQFIKIKTSHYCCSSQVNNEFKIVEWCIMDKSEMFKKIFKELKIKSSLKLEKYLLRLGKIRSNGCENCKTVYMFQKVGKKLIDPFDRASVVMDAEELLELVQEEMPCTIDELNENYYLPKWFVFKEMPDYATKDGKRILYKEDKFKVNNYQTLQEYANGKIKDITFNQIDSLMRIKISDYDLSKKQIQSDDPLFQRIEGTFAYIEKHYSLPEWIHDYKPVNEQLTNYLKFTYNEIENMPYTDELLKLKVNDINPELKSNKYLFTLD